ncbi:MAG: N-acetyltransferase family protein [Phycisphaerae bacterium]
MPDADWTIRPAARSDAAALRAMWSQMADQHNSYDRECWDWTPDSPKAFEARFLEMLGDDDAVVLVAVDGGDAPIGYAVGRCEESAAPSAVRRKGTVYDLFVLSDWRAHGIGERLMHVIESELKQQGARELHLQVARDNETAIRFYQALGMRPVAVRMYKRL